MNAIKQVFPETLTSPATYCRFFYRAEQASGDIENQVSGGPLAVKNAGFTDPTLWATAGYATIGGGASNFCTVAAPAFNFTLDGFSLVVAVRLQKAAAAFPAAEQFFIASYDPGVNNGGIILSCRADGQARCYLNTLDNTTINANTAAGAITNGTTANENSFVYFFPREGGSAWSMVNAILGNSSAAGTVSGKSLAGNRTARLGAPLAGGSVDAYRIASFSAYQVPKDLTAINRQAVGDWCLRNPGQPVPDWVFE